MPASPPQGTDSCDTDIWDIHSHGNQSEYTKDSQMVSQLCMCGQLKLCNPHKPARTGHAFGTSLIWSFLADCLHFLAVSRMFQCWLLQCDMTTFSYTALNTCDLNVMQQYCDCSHLFYLWAALYLPTPSDVLKDFAFVIFSTSCLHWFKN